LEKLILTWAILRLVWEAKGYGLKEMPGRLRKEFANHKEGFGRTSLTKKTSKKDKEAPSEVVQYVLDDTRLPIRAHREKPVMVVRLGLAALKGEPLPEGTKPAEVAQALRAEFPADEVAAKLADAFSKQGGLLDTLGDKLKAVASAFFGPLDALASGVAGKLDALASGVAGRLDALARSVASGFAALGTMLADIRSGLDVVNGKLDRILGSLGVVAATVNDLDAKADLAALARERETGRILRAVGRVGGVIRLLGVVGLAAFLVLLVSGRWAHREGTNSVTTPASVTQAPAPLVVVVNGATGTMANFRSYLGAVAQMGKKTQDAQENWIPKEPLPFQKLEKDCDREQLREEPINGGCWVEMKGGAPCGKLLFRHGDKCYRPVAADPTKPVGLFPDQR